jgi:hypothetical protein
MQHAAMSGCNWRFKKNTRISCFRRRNSTKIAPDFTFCVHSCVGMYTEEKRKIFHLLGIEQAFLGRAARSLATIPGMP